MHAVYQRVSICISSLSQGLVYANSQDLVALFPVTYGIVYGRSHCLFRAIVLSLACPTNPLPHAHIPLESLLQKDHTNVTCVVDQAFSRRGTIDNYEMVPRGEENLRKVGIESPLHPAPFSPPTVLTSGAVTFMRYILCKQGTILSQSLVGTMRVPSPDPSGSWFHCYTSFLKRQFEVCQESLCGLASQSQTCLEVLGSRTRSVVDLHPASILEPFTALEIHAFCVGARRCARGHPAASVNILEKFVHWKQHTHSFLFPAALESQDRFPMRVCAPVQ